MDVENLTISEKKKCVTEFKTRCYLFHRAYKVYKTLFEDNMDIYGSLESPKVINHALVDHLLLQPHIITDHANFGTKQKNLSVFFFLEWPWEAEERRQLEKLAHELKEFVEFEGKDNPRHKLLAHWDVETIISRSGALGAFQAGKEWEFFDNLSEFIEIMVKHFRIDFDWTILDARKADENVLVEILKKAAS